MDPQPDGFSERHRVLGRESGHWIEDDGLLRDEGTLFGMAAYRFDGTEPLLQHKLDAIRKHYASPASEAASARTAAEGEIGRASEERGRVVTEAASKREGAKTHERDAGRLLAESHTLDAHEAGAGHQTWRLGTGVAAAVATCTTSYWVVLDHLSRSGFDHPEVVSAAVVLGGHFNLFQPLSVLFASDEALRARTEDPELWKRHLTEWLLPLGASLFVAVNAWPAFGAARSAAAFLLLVGLFVVVGRLLLGKLTHLARARRRHLMNRSDARQHTADAARLREEAGRCDERVRALDDVLQKCRDDRDRHAAEGARLERVAEYKVQLFRSEYEFALHAMRRRGEAGRARPTPFDDEVEEAVLEVVPTPSPDPA